MKLEDLRRAVELLPAGAAVTLPREAILDALTAPIVPVRPGLADEPEKWLTSDECAAMLNVSVRWCYDHAEELGVKRLSRRCVRFSSRAVARYLARRG